MIFYCKNWCAVAILTILLFFFEPKNLNWYRVLSFLLWRHIIYLCLVWHTVNSTLFNLPLSFVLTLKREIANTATSMSILLIIHMSQIDFNTKILPHLNTFTLFIFPILSFVWLRLFHHMKLFIPFLRLLIANWNSWVSVTSIVFDKLFLLPLYTFR